MIPLRDENPTRSRAWMTLFLIAANVTVSLIQWAMPQAQLQEFVYRAAMIPARLSGSVDLPGLPPLLTLLTSQFLHGGFLHLGGNMLFLWIFGNNVEDEMGPIRFLVFYLLCGIGAGLAHYATAPGSAIPTVGASGAISGVLGAYALMFPRARIQTLVILVFWISVVPIPALLWVGVWFLLQFLQGVASRGTGGGVAWFAHVGGLIVGVLLLYFFRARRGRRRIELSGEAGDRD
jgi:membrane associated rhomboid family serine protease